MTMKRSRRSSAPHHIRTSWNPLARWYDGWVGKEGSLHHRKLAIPSVMSLLAPQPDEKILDIGAGQGVLAPHIAATGAHYVGVEVSPQLLQFAHKHHGKEGLFLAGDARHLQRVPGLRQGGFDAAVFLLSVQDMDPLAEVLAEAARMLRAGGRIVILMLHPCFRIPRLSGWGRDEGRKLDYRRIDRYLTSLTIPMKAYPGKQQGVSWSFHRPLQEYINTLATVGLLVDQIQEIPTYKGSEVKEDTQVVNAAHQEIPLFLGLRARKL